MREGQRCPLLVSVGLEPGLGLECELELELGLGLGPGPGLGEVAQARLVRLAGLVPLGLEPGLELEPGPGLGGRVELARLLGLLQLDCRRIRCRRSFYIHGADKCPRSA